MLRRNEPNIIHRKKQSLEEYEAQKRRENELKKKLEQERLAYLETLKPKNIEITQEKERGHPADPEIHGGTCEEAEILKPITFPVKVIEEEAKPVKQHRRKRKMKVIYESDTDETE